MELNKIYNIDCIEYMRTLQDESVDLIIADPPYLQVVKEQWDNQWEAEQDYINWCRGWIRECCRILKSNGNIVIWGQLGEKIHHLCKTTCDIGG